MSEPTPTSYFNITIDCFGYLNRIREPPAGKGKRAGSFMACSIAALQGPTDKPEYTYFDAKVSGRDAQHLIRRCQPAVDAKRKVLIGVRLSDPWIDQFTYPDDHKDPKKRGQSGASLKVRLLLIKWIKVDGKTVYTRPKDDTTAQNRESSVPDESDAVDYPNGTATDLPAPELPAADAEPAEKAA